MTHDVFISHSSKDRAIGDAACAALEKCGYRCWIAPRDILPGEDYGEAIVDAIRGSRIFLLVVSAASVASSQVRRETERAANAGSAIIPFRIEDVLPSKSLEFFISSAHWLDAISRPIEPHLDYLCKVVERLLAEADGSTVPPMPLRAMAAPAAAAPAATASEARRLPAKPAIALAAIAALAGVGGVAVWRGSASDPAANKVTAVSRSIFTRRAVGTDSTKPVRLRAGPSYEAETIAIIGTDDVFRVAPRQGDWWPAQLANGNQGYVHAAWISVIDADGGSRPAQPLPAGNQAAPANEAAAAPPPATSNRQ
ncbi:MAG: TIR domain-containing protein [Sphingomonas sp.]